MQLVNEYPEIQHSFSFNCRIGAELHRNVINLELCSADIYSYENISSVKAVVGSLPP